jgi:Putative transposase
MRSAYLSLVVGSIDEAERICAALSDGSVPGGGWAQSIAVIGSDARSRAAERDTRCFGAQCWGAAIDEAMKKELIVSEASTEELRVMLETQYERWWNVYVDPIKSKWYFLRYVARYVRRPPIAQHRFTKITDREVESRRGAQHNS